MSTAVHGARKAKVNHAAAPPTARQPDARTARSAANQPRPMAAPMAILLTVSLSTAARMASTACARLRVSGVRRTVTASTDVDEPDDDRAGHRTRCAECFPERTTEHDDRTQENGKSHDRQK